MNRSAWILLSGGLVVLAFVPGACGGNAGTTTATGTGTGGAVASSTASSHAASSQVATVGVVTGFGGSMMSAAICNAPQVPPSQGACYLAPPPPPPPVCPHGAGGGGGASSASASSAAASVGSASSTASSGAGGAFDCSTAVAMPSTCGVCVENTCCAELTACGIIPNCLPCALGTLTDPAICHTDAIKMAILTLYACDQGCCPADCYKPNIPCNPVTNEPCQTDVGETCDIASTGFLCQDRTSDVAICEMCDEVQGPFCGPGLTCLPDGGCAKYCCDDGDCGSGVCNKSLIPGEVMVGVCVRK